MYATAVPLGTRLADASSGDWLAVVRGDRALITWEPSLGYDWPLRVGKRFNREYRLVNHMLKQETRIRSIMKVELFERVVVPAGAFDAFKVRYADSTGLESVTWYCPVTGLWVRILNDFKGSHPDAPGRQELELLSFERSTLVASARP